MIDKLKDKNILVIVESPTKTSHIKEYLHKAGYSKTRVMASVGHISNIQDSRDSFKNTGIYPNKNFFANYQVTEDKKEVVKKLKAYADNADYVYLASDPDREGSQIAWSLIKFLNIPETKYRRMVTHEITPKAVVKAFENPINLETSLIRAAQARAIIDKLIGYSLSPISKTYVGAKSVGRCQSAGLKILVDRELEIRNFKPETYYDIYLHFTKKKTNFKAKYVGSTTKIVDHLTTLAEVNLVKSKCEENNNCFMIKSIDDRLKIENPANPFITATLQQEANKKFGLSIKDIMNICQTLFENGYITYHRSDSPILSPEFISTAKQFIEDTYSKDLYVGPQKIKLAENSQEGHEAIRCVNVHLAPDQAKNIINNSLHLKVYTLIWKRTIQSLMKPATYSTQNILINCGDQLFKFEQKSLKDPGFKSLDK